MPSPGTRTDEAMIRAVRRNPHAMNKRSRGQAARQSKFQAYTVSQLLETYRDPRAVLLEIAGMPTAELANLANCSLLEALQERRLCALAVLPYVSQKLPVQVDMRHTKAIHLNIVESGAAVPSGHSTVPGKHEQTVDVPHIDHVQFAELQAIAASTDEPILQLLTIVRPIESGVVEGDGTHVRPSVAGDSPGESERKPPS